MENPVITSGITSGAVIIPRQQAAAAEAAEARQRNARQCAENDGTARRDQRQLTATATPPCSTCRFIVE